MHSCSRAIRHSGTNVSSNECPDIGTDVGSNKRADASDKCSYFRSDKSSFCRSIEGTNGTDEHPDFCPNKYADDAESDAKSDGCSIRSAYERTHHDVSDERRKASSIRNKPRCRMRFMQARFRLRQVE